MATTTLSSWPEAGCEPSPAVTRLARPRTWRHAPTSRSAAPTCPTPRWHNSCCAARASTRDLGHLAALAAEDHVYPHATLRKFHRLGIADDDQALAVHIAVHHPELVSLKKMELKGAFPRAFT